MGMDPILERFCKRLIALDMDIFGLRKQAQDADEWVTVHPGGKGPKVNGSGMKGGTPVLIDGETGEIKGGMGGKHTGKTISEVKKETKQKKLAQKKVGNASAKVQQNKTSIPPVYTAQKAAKANEPSQASSATQKASPITENKSGNAIAKQGFATSSIPTTNDMVANGFYDNGAVPDGYFKDVPHVKNAHPGIVPLNGNVFDVPQEAKDVMYKRGKVTHDYEVASHNNVPYASMFGSESGRDAALTYTSQSTTINRMLRGNSDEDDLKSKDDTVSVIKELDKMMSVSRAKEPMVVYRGIHGLSSQKFYEDFAEGAEMQDKGFMSTSIDPNRAKIFAGSGYGLVKILVPKGASAMSMRYKEDGTDFSAFPNENEILLPRNTKYRVVGFEKGKGALSKYKKIPIVEIVG